MWSSVSLPARAGTFCWRGSVLNRFLSEVRDVTVQVVPMNKPLRRG